MIKWIKCVIPRKEPLFQNEITRLKSWFFHSLLVFWVKELKWTHPVHTCSVIFNGMCKGRPSQNTTIIWKELLGQSMNTLAWISLQAGRQYLIHSDGRGKGNSLKLGVLFQNGGGSVWGRTGSWGGGAERAKRRWLYEKYSLPCLVVAGSLCWAPIATQPQLIFTKAVIYAYQNCHIHLSFLPTKLFTYLPLNP